MNDKNFVNGMTVKVQNFDNGGFIVKLGIKIEELIDFLYPLKEKGEWCNIDLKQGKESGKWYAELNTYKKEVKEDEISEDEIPF